MTESLTVHDTQHLAQLAQSLDLSFIELTDIMKRFAPLLDLSQIKDRKQEFKHLRLTIKAILEARERGISENDMPKALLLWNRIRLYGEFNIVAYGSLLLELKELDHFENKTSFDLDSNESLFLFEHVTLRHKPAILDFDDIKNLVQEQDIYNKVLNETGEGFGHLYRGFRLAGKKVVMDYSTGLMWQQRGSFEPLALNDANAYIKQLNSDKFAGFTNWRLPTCDELASLTTNVKNKDELFIDAIFHPVQWHCWTSDSLKALPRAWVVYFDNAAINVSQHKKSFVRAVRSAAEQ